MKLVSVPAMVMFVVEPLVFSSAVTTLIPNEGTVRKVAGVNPTVLDIEPVSPLTLVCQLPCLPEATLVLLKPIAHATMIVLPVEVAPEAVIAFVNVASSKE